METVFKVLRDVGLRHMIARWKDIHVYFILKLILEFLKTKRISYDFSSKDGRISEIPISGGKWLWVRNWFMAELLSSNDDGMSNDDWALTKKVKRRFC